MILQTGVDLMELLQWLEVCQFEARSPEAPCTLTNALARTESTRGLIATIRSRYLAAQTSAVQWRHH
jgi:hypothetical protein